MHQLKHTFCCCILHIIHKGPFDIRYHMVGIVHKLKDLITDEALVRPPFIHIAVKSNITGKYNLQVIHTTPMSFLLHHPSYIY